jgi:hypothetical protein
VDCMVNASSYSQCGVCGIHNRTRKVFCYVTLSETKNFWVPDVDSHRVGLVWEFHNLICR